MTVSRPCSYIELQVEKKVLCRVKLDPQLTLYMNHLKRQQRLKHRAWNHENKRKTQGERRDMGVDKVSLDMTPKAQAAKTEPGQGKSGK